MIAVIFQNPQMAWLFIIPLLLFAAFKIYNKRRQADLQKFAGNAILKSGRSLRHVKLAMLCTATLFITFALMEPVWKKSPKQLRKEGRDLVFILDVSNSMKAQDLSPNRLEKAKILITECVNSLKDDRVGLVVFAGSASIKCPLTLDYDFFLHILGRVDGDSVEHGGTRIEDAVLKTCDKIFGGDQTGNRDIILISDGGDFGKSVDKAVEAVNNSGAKIITIGLGDKVKGARIPLDDGSGFMTTKDRNGKVTEVWTKLENSHLQVFSKKCQAGAYLPAGTKQMDLAQVYRQFSRNQQGESVSEQTIMVYEDEFETFLVIAFILLITMVLTPASLKKSSNAVSVLILFLFTYSMQAESLEQAEKAYRKGMYKDAVQYFSQLVDKHTAERARIYFKIGNCYYRQNDYKNAMAAFKNALYEFEGESELKALVNYNLANSLNRYAASIDDKYEAVTKLSESLGIYRRVIIQQPQFKEAAINFELTKKLYLKTKEELKKEQEQLEQMKKELAAVKEGLEKLVEDQTKLNKEAVKDKKANLNHLVAREKTILQETTEVKKKLESLDAKDKVLFKMAVFEASLNFVGDAIINEESAVKEMPASHENSMPFLKNALNSLKEALNALPEDPRQQKQNQDNEGEGDDEGEESEEESDEGEEGDGNIDSEVPPMNQEMDEQRMDKPSDSVEEILKTEEKLHEMRKAQTKRSKAKKVEKDW